MYNPKPELAAQGVACCDVVNRGLVFDNGRLFFNTLDNHTIAIDAESGKLIWDTKVGDINTGETMTMAPLVVKGRVLVGDSGGEMGIRGWLKALDANSGNVVWTAYHTGPDKDVLIGPSFKPFYDKDKVRPRPGSDLLRHRQPGAVESGTASRRQQVDVDAVRSQAGDRRSGVGLPALAARSARL
jgi:glucose dehydrogenase